MCLVINFNRQIENRKRDRLLSIILKLHYVSFRFLFYSLSLSFFMLRLTLAEQRGEEKILIENGVTIIQSEKTSN